jgi:hypothetical protein
MDEAIPRHGAVAVRSEPGTGIWFEVCDADSSVLAVSHPFATICSLEASLGMLSRVSHDGWTARQSGDQTIVGMGRRQVRLVGSHTEEALAKILVAIAAARIDDQRPHNRRRFDLSGVRCSDLA